MGAKRTGVVAADVEIVFVSIAIADYACLEVVTAWWSDGRIGGCVGGTGRSDSESEREIDDEEEGRECERHCSKCLCFRICFLFFVFFFLFQLPQRMNLERFVNPVSCSNIMSLLRRSSRRLGPCSILSSNRLLLRCGDA